MLRPMKTDPTLLPNNTQHCWELLGTCCVRLHGSKSLTGFELYAKSANKCHHCCGSMQTDATSHNIVGPNNVGCCWPTMLGPFAWTFRMRKFYGLIFFRVVFLGFPAVIPEVTALPPPPALTNIAEKQITTHDFVRHPK